MTCHEKRFTTRVEAVESAYTPSRPLTEEEIRALRLRPDRRWYRDRQGRLYYALERSV